MLARWRWRHQIEAQIINTDIDGLLSAALLWHRKRWPIAGLYDTENLWLEDRWCDRLPSNLDKVAWVDIDMCWPGALSVSQHVISAVRADHVDVVAYRDTINPSLIAVQFDGPGASYQCKYPFGTYQWLSWLASEPAPQVSDVVETGLAWMPDGGFQSVRGPWKANCEDWATRRLPGSSLAPLVEAGRSEEAEEFVAAAERMLIQRSGVAFGWKNHQYRMSAMTSMGASVLSDPSTAEGAAEITSLLHAIADIYGWDPASCPTDLRRHQGTWMTGAPPDGWPDAANRWRVVSLAVTARSTYCYTLPESRDPRWPSLAAVLRGVDGG